MRNKDDEITFFANEFHLLTRAHLAELTGRNPKSLNESLRRLVRQRRLYRKSQSIFKPYVYAAYDIRKRHHFDHDLPITDIHLAFHKTGRLIEWRQCQEKRKGEINEDAVFWLSVPLRERLGRIKYYFEFDTGTEPSWQVDERFTRYLSLRGQTTEPFNVLFVCIEKERAARLVSRAERFLDPQNPASRKLLLFADLQDLLINALGSICAVAHDSAMYPIAPNLLN